MAAALTGPRPMAVPNTRVEYVAFGTQASCSVCAHSFTDGTNNGCLRYHPGDGKWTLEKQTKRGKGTFLSIRNEYPSEAGCYNRPCDGCREAMCLCDSFVCCARCARCTKSHDGVGCAFMFTKHRTGKVDLDAISRQVEAHRVVKSDVRDPGTPGRKAAEEEDADPGYKGARLLVMALGHKSHLERVTKESLVRGPTAPAPGGRPPKRTSLPKIGAAGGAIRRSHAATRPVRPPTSGTKRRRRASIASRGRLLLTGALGSCTVEGLPSDGEPVTPGRLEELRLPQRPASSPGRLPASHPRRHGRVRSWDAMERHGVFRHPEIRAKETAERRAEYGSHIGRRNRRREGAAMERKFVKLQPLRLDHTNSLVA